MKIKRDGITYTLSPKTLTAVVSGCDEKKEGKVVLPAQVEHKGQTYAVTKIGRSAFDRCSQMQSIVIPNGVQSIECGAFSGCERLMEIFIPKSVTNIDVAIFCAIPIYKDYADPHSFLKMIYSHLVSIIVEKGNKVYDSRNNCNAIIETTTNTLIAGCAKTIIPNDIQIIGEWAFSDCIDLVSIDIPNSVKNISKYAFYRCRNLSSVTLHNGIFSIGVRAFESTNLKSIYIPESIQEIQYYLFSGCPLESIVVDSSNPVYDSRDNCNAIIETSTNTLIVGCANTHIPSSVTRIGTGAFVGYTTLTHIDIPASVRVIDWAAFDNCENMITITFHEGLHTINCDFSGCKRLKELIFPKTLKEYNTQIGRDCNSLKTLIIPNNASTLWGNVKYKFYNSPQLTYLQLTPIMLASMFGDTTHPLENEMKKDEIHIAMENDNVYLSFPKATINKYFRLRPDCQISIGEEEKGTICFGDIFEGAEETETGEG